MKIFRLPAVIEGVGTESAVLLDTQAGGNTIPDYPAHKIAEG